MHDLKLRLWALGCHCRLLFAMIVFLTIWAQEFTAAAFCYLFHRGDLGDRATWEKRLWLLNAPIREIKAHTE